MVERTKRMRNLAGREEREEKEKPEVSQGGSKKVRHRKVKKKKSPETNVDKEKHTKLS